MVREEQFKTVGLLIVHKWRELNTDYQTQVDGNMQMNGF